MKLILGSSSPFRKKVLEDAGLSFEIIKPEINEENIRGETHFLTPVILSYAKAKAVADKIDHEAVIISCDQVIVCDGNILEKPKEADEIRKWYDLYERNHVHYANGLTVLNTKTGRSLSAEEVSITTFKPIPKDFIESEIERGVIFNCSGGIGDNTIDSYGTIIKGSRDSITGMPISSVMKMIDRIK